MFKNVKIPLKINSPFCHIQKVRIFFLGKKNLFPLGEKVKYNTYKEDLRVKNSN